jgi:hypothetical protein
MDRKNPNETPRATFPKCRRNSIDSACQSRITHSIEISCQSTMIAAMPEHFLKLADQVLV